MRRAPLQPVCPVSGRTMMRLAQLCQESEQRFSRRHNRARSAPRPRPLAGGERGREAEAPTAEASHDRGFGAGPGHLCSRRQRNEEAGVAREIEIVFVESGVVGHVELLDDEAPKTCAAVWDALPRSGPGSHAMYSGTCGALFFDDDSIGAD